MSMLGVNLIPIARRQAAACRQRARCWTWGIAAYAGVLLASYAACAVAISTETDDTAAALDKATRRIEELNRTAGSLRPQLAEMQTKLQVARTVGDQPNWSHLLAVLSATLDDEIVLTSTQLDSLITEARPTTRPGERNASPPTTVLNINLHGLARSQLAVTRFVLRLENLGLFERVELISSFRQGDADANSFQVRCVLHTSATGGRAR